MGECAAICSARHWMDTPVIMCISAQAGVGSGSGEIEEGVMCKALHTGNSSCAACWRGCSHMVIGRLDMRGV